MLPHAPEFFSANTFVGSFKKEVVMNTYGYYEDGVVYLVVSFDKVKSNVLESMVTDFKRRNVIQGELSLKGAVILGGFKGREYDVKLQRSDNTIHKGLINFYAAKKHTYMVEVIGGDKSNPTVQRFLDSFKLDSQPTGLDAANIPKTQKTITTLAPNVPSTGETTLEAYSPKEVTHKAYPVWRPEAQYTEEARKYGVTGTVIIRAVLAASGRVSGIRVVSGLPEGLTEKAILAAHQIFFIPALKDGQRVSQYIQIEYSFNLH